jgi:nicotinamide-nucleotide amidase
MQAEPVPPAEPIHRAEVIAVGSELTSGAKLDTNSQWLSLELAAVGVPVWYHTTIADDLAATVELFKQAAARSDLVIVTGGLGPTLDDLTRQGLTDAAGVPLVLHGPSLARIKALFETRGRVMPERNVVQAVFPAGSEPIPNPRGTAPGIWMELPRPGGVCRFVVLPGVPSEMKPMFRESVLPRLPSGGRVIRRYRVNTFGAGESAVEEKLGDLTARGREPEVGITAHEATITLRITATAGTAAECDRQAAAVKAVLRERLGELVFGEEDEELQHVVVRRLAARGETLAVVETPLSGGRLTEWLTAVPGVGRVLRGGLTAVSLDMGVPIPGSAALAGEADHQAARMLAEAYRTAFQATWGLAVVGAPAGEGDPGTGTIAVVGPDCVTTVPYRSFGDPAIDRSRVAKTGLDLLRRRLVRA